MKKILAFATSNSRQSINHKALAHLTTFLPREDVQLLDIRDWDIPIYDVDLEREQGVPLPIQQLAQQLQTADGLILALAEHNAYITAFFKNILDWLSRVDRYFLSGKKVMLVGVTPGRGGAAYAIEAMRLLVHRYGGEVAAELKIPSYRYNTVEEGSGVRFSNAEIRTEAQQKLEEFAHALTMATAA